MMNDAEIEKAKLNLETAQSNWLDLQRFFAQGNVIWVDTSLDLIDVAYAVAEDNSKKIKTLMESKHIAAVSDAQAKTWLKQESKLWTVVVRPLILVQEAAA